MAKIKNRNNLLDLSADESGEMSFDEIGEVLGIPEWKVKSIFNKAMKKLSTPKLARELWEYKNISNNDTFSDMAGRSH